MTDVALPAPAVAPEAPARPDFQIVPLRGLPVVGAVLVALVVAIASNRLWPLEFFHVAAGGLWTSFDLFLGFVLGPIIGRMAVPARIDLTTKLMPKLLLIMPTIVTCTLASGWQLGRLLGTIDSGYANHSLDRRVVHRRRRHGGHRARPCSSPPTSRCCSSSRSRARIRRSSGG